MVVERKINITYDQEGRVSDLEKAKSELATSWATLSNYLPESLDPHHKKFVRSYFRAQVRINAGRKVKGGRILDGLDKRPGFKEFEQGNQKLLAAIDIAVRGQTNRVDEIGRPIEPLFTLGKKRNN